MFKNTAFSILAAALLAAPGMADACPRTSPATALPLGIASSDSSSITFSLSNKGKLTVRRTLSVEIPADANSCTASLEGRYSRKLSYSATKVLGTKSTLSPVITFTAKRLPAVKPDEFRKQIVQPTLHVRVKTECVDKDGMSVLSDTTPVVARYIECGASRTPVGMGAFIKSLTRQLRR